MTAKALLEKLLKDIKNLSPGEYDRLCEITDDPNFISLSERQVEFWVEDIAA